MIDKNWSRWIFASVSNHFNNRKEDLPLFIEGQHRDTREDQKEPGTVNEFLELRMDGPKLTETSKDDWNLYFEINILVQVTMDDFNATRIHRNVGIVAAAFTDIGIFKVGKTDDDDGSLLECLRLIQDKRRREAIVVSHFGQIEPKTKLIHATVEGHYEVDLIA